MSFLATMTLLNAIKAALLPLKGSLNAVEVDLFEKVALFGSEEFDRAMKEELVFKKRVAFVIPSGDRFETQIVGDVIIVRMFSSVDVMVGDLNYGIKSSAAMMGGTKNVGVVSMKDATLAALGGQSLGLPGGVALAPTGSDVLAGPKAENGEPGRQVWVLTFETFAGDLRVSRPR
jgi:hypothetical protein